MWNITTNEFNNRDRYAYVEYPGFTPWTGDSFAANVWEFLVNPRAVDWTRQFEIKKEV